MLERLLLLWLTVLSGIALWWPSGWPDPFVATASWLAGVIVLTMFAIGLMLPRDEVHQVIKRWPLVLGGTAIQYTAMPALAYFTARLFGLEGDFLIGAILVGCVPGAMASNVLTLNAHGNASYSVSLTTAATLLSPIAVPIALGLTFGVWSGKHLEVIANSAWFMLLVVVLPVVGGHLLGRSLPRHEALFRQVAPKIANLAILWIIAVVVALNRKWLVDVPAALLVALLVVNLGGYLAGFLGGRVLRLPPSMQKALTLEVGMQNAGLGATLATHLFPDNTATAIAPALYTFGCMLTGTVLARLLVYAMPNGRESATARAA